MKYFLSETILLFHMIHCNRLIFAIRKIENSWKNAKKNNYKRQNANDLFFISSVSLSRFILLLIFVLELLLIVWKQNKQKFHRVKILLLKIFLMVIFWYRKFHNHIEPCLNRKIIFCYCRSWLFNRTKSPM